MNRRPPPPGYRPLSVTGGGQPPPPLPPSGTRRTDKKRQREREEEEEEEEDAPPPKAPPSHQNKAAPPARTVVVVETPPLPTLTLPPAQAAPASQDNDFVTEDQIRSAIVIQDAIQGGENPGKMQAIARALGWTRKAPPQPATPAQVVALSSMASPPCTTAVSLYNVTQTTLMDLKAIVADATKQRYHADARALICQLEAILAGNTNKA